ncbi:MULTISPECIES: DUF6477 family protein [unclassified Yoonia]|uniref:DUF6477 family protein n=1 Tax=unclassified Yoonia TaxID=2629118 RepID=UPI003729A4B0
MFDIHTRLATLKRPQLLARAARFGVDDYRRNVHLRRLLDCDDLPRHAQALMQLFDIENEMNDARLAKSGNYSPARHVEVLIAIAGEGRLLQMTALRLT